MSTHERPSASARARFLQAAARQTATRPRAWYSRVAFAGFGILLWLLAMFFVLGARADWHDLPPTDLVVTIVSLSVAALFASTIGLARGRAMVGTTTEVLSLAALGIPLALLLLVSLVDPHGPSTVTTAAALDAQLRHAWPCGLLVFLIGLPLVGTGMFVLRGLTLSRPGLSGACLGLAAATWAHLLLRVHCPIGGADHAILGHLLPLLPLMVLGAWLMRRR